VTRFWTGQSVMQLDGLVRLYVVLIVYNISVHTTRAHHFEGFDDILTKENQGMPIATRIKKSCYGHKFKICK
jgi:hypothetical protein